MFSLRLTCRLPLHRASPFSTSAVRHLSTTALSRKALAHTTPPPERDAKLAETVRAQGPASQAAKEVVQGKREGRTLEQLSLEGKRCVVTHAHSSIALTLAASLLEAGANDLVLLATPPSSPDVSPSSTFPSRDGSESSPSSSPAEQLQTLARDKNWEGATIQEVKLTGHEVKDLEVCARSCEEKLGGKVDVLLAGPPRDEEDAAANTPLLSLFCRLMASPPATPPYSAPTNSRSVILLSTPYGPRVDLPQPQLLSQQPPPTLEGQLTKRKPGAAEMSRLAAVLGAEWAKRGVRVNCIAPGFLRTPEVSSLLHSDPSLEEKWENATPLGRIGGVEEVKGAAVYLAGDSSRFTTGTTLVIDGGFSLV